MQFSSWTRLVKLYERKLTRLLSRYRNPADPAFQRAARKVAEDMAKEAAGANARSWREAALKSTRAKEIYRILQKEIDETGLREPLRMVAEHNAQLISSLPADIASHISQRAASLQREGKRAGEIEKELRALAPRLTKYRIRMIARTEISKSETDLTRARAERIDVRWYEWSTSEDSRVRPSHRNMDKVLVAWNEPPPPEKLIGEKSTLGNYHAGQCPQCRCLALPLISLDEVRWPARVYSHGSVQRMTRADFAALSGMEYVRRAAMA